MVRHDEVPSLCCRPRNRRPPSYQRFLGLFLSLTLKPCQVPFMVSIMVLLVPFCQALSYTPLMPQPRKKPQPTSESTNEAIGLRIKQCRIKQGLSQANLADKTGVSREAIAAYETGRVHLLDDMIARIAQALTVSADELLGLKTAKSLTDQPQLRLTRRFRELEKLPEQKRKAILKTLDDLIRANS